MALSHQTVTIANGEALSTSINIEDQVIVGIVMPAAWTAADITFQGGLRTNDDAAPSAFFDLYDQLGAEVLLDNPVAGKWHTIEPAPFASPSWIKLRSGTTGSPTNQGAARTLTVVTRCL